MFVHLFDNNVLVTFYLHEANCIFGDFSLSPKFIRVIREPFPAADACLELSV